MLFQILIFLKIENNDEIPRSVIYSNRAHVRILLGKYPEAVTDATKSLDFNPNNMKSYYRAAKAATALSLWKKTMDAAAPRRPGREYGY